MSSVVDIDGEADAAYLQEALARAGIKARIGQLSTETLTGGRTGARVDKLVTDDGSYILKQIPVDNWRQAAMNCPGEGALWLSGALSEPNLPSPLKFPTIDTVLHGPSDSWWMLMHDVGDGIAGRGKFGEAETRALWSAIAKLHARYWDKRAELEDLPLPQLRETTKAFAEPVYGAISGEFREPWVEDFIEDFMPLRVLLPKFLEMLTPGDADFFQSMVGNRAWHHDLDVATPTFLHGDLRRANISFEADDIHLFDWEFASIGPAASDLQWCSFLTFWAYTPDDGVEPWERDHLREHYMAELETTLGFPIDRAEFDRTWDLSWLRVMSELGFCFADADLDDDDERKLVSRRVDVAFEICRRTLGA